MKSFPLLGQPGILKCWETCIIICIYDDIENLVWKMLGSYPGKVCTLTAKSLSHKEEENEKDVSTDGDSDVACCSMYCF